MAAHNATVKSSELRSRLHGLALRGAHLTGRKQAEELQRDALTADVAAAKGRMLLAPEVASVFEGLQTLAHQRSVGSLEALLTAILQDVLPEEGAIRMLPSYKANNTHLDILLDKGGHLEDVVDGNGGAVTNVVCAGLRFAALARTGNRRLMVLDEPDCWLKPERVPAFVQTISQVSRQGGFQTFFITHHNPALFEGHFNIVKFGLDGAGKVTATALSPQVTGWRSDDEPGLRKIELINVRRHEHTVVPCFPGSTAYIGDNNLGKSTALMSALKIVAYGESDDSVIRHECEEARIVLHLENNQRVEWSRHTKRSPAVLYRLYRGDELLSEGRPKTRNQAPEWVFDVLGISRVDDLDIQVGNQKSPVFLLNDSAPRRAQILSVGRESSYLPQLMREYEASKAADREIIKQGEATLARLRLRAAYMGRVPTLVEKLNDLSEKAERAISALESRERLEGVLSRLEERTKRVAQLTKEVAVLSDLPPAPVLTDTTAMAQLLQRLTRLSRVSQVPPLPPLPAQPVLKDLAQLRDLGVRIARGQKALAALAQLPKKLPVMPELQDTAQLLQRIDGLARQANAVHTAKLALSAADADLVAATEELNRLTSELGDQCPLCGGVLAHVSTSTEHPHHAHAH